MGERPRVSGSDAGFDLKMSGAVSSMEILSFSSMSFFNKVWLVFALGCVGLASCQSTIPDQADLARFEEQATVMAQRQIGLLDKQLAAGEITQEQHDRSVAAIQADIPRRAHDLAWTRHELAESEKRALGVPTGDAPMGVRSPGLGQVHDSFYRPKGEVGSGFGAFQGINGSTNVRGYSPGTVDGMRGDPVPTDYYQ